MAVFEHICARAGPKPTADRRRETTPAAPPQHAGFLQPELSAGRTLFLDGAYTIDRLEGQITLEADSGVDQRTQRGRGRKALPGAGTEQDNFNFQRRQKSDAVKPDVRVCTWHPVSFNACGLYDDACLVTLAVDFDVTGPVAGYGVVPVAVCEVKFQ